MLSVFWMLCLAGSSASALVRAPSNSSCQRTDVPLQSWHIHVLFPPSDAARTAAALRLQQQFIEAFGLRGRANCTMSAGDPAPHARMCAFEVDWLPAGPFLTAQYSFFVPSQNLTAAVAWTLRHRGDLDVLVHPNSGCEVEDHTAWALWGGQKWELDTSIFSCEYPGCVPASSTEAGAGAAEPQGLSFIPAASSQ